MRNNIATIDAGHTALSPILKQLALMGSPNPGAALRALSPLPKNSQEIIDGAIIKVGRDNLVIANDLINAGLTVGFQNWLSATTYTTSRVSDIGTARRGMIPDTRGERAVPDVDELSVPIFCTWADWQLDPRFLATAERVGYPLDTTIAEAQTRRVNELIEDSVINGVVDANGDLVKIYGLPTYGLLNAPNANTQVYEGGTAWDNPAKTGSGILVDVLAMLAKAKAANVSGPFKLYIPTTYGFALAKEYTAGYPLTILSRLQQIPNLSSITVVDRLPANRTILMPLRSDVIDLIVGQLPSSFSWPTNPGMPFSGISSMVLAVVIPRVKWDYNNQSGIVLGYTS